MRILGVSVLGLLELAARWHEREEARRMANGDTTAPFEDRPWLRAAPRVALDGGTECTARTVRAEMRRGERD